MFKQMKAVIGIPICLVTAMITLTMMTMAAGTAKAQPFADQIPEEAFLYVSWKGTTGLGDQYSSSNLKKAADAFEIDKLKASLMTLMDQGLAMAPGAPDKKAVDAAENMAGYFWKYPTALSVTMDVSGVKSKADKPQILVHVFCKAGADSQALSSLMTKAAAENEKGSADVSTQGDTVVMVYKSEDANSQLSGRKLKDSASFIAEAGKGIKDPALSFFLDTESLINQLEKGLGAAQAQQELMQMQAFLETTGIKGLKTASMTAGYKGGNWAQHFSLNIPEPRSGQMKLLKQKALTVDDLKAVPARTSWLYAISLDPSEIFTGITNIMQKMSPMEHQQMTQMMAMMKMQMQLDIEKDFIGSLGHSWMVFSDLGLTGMPIQMTNLWLVNKTRDGAKLNRLINQFWPMVAMQAGQDPATQLEDVNVSGVQVKKITTNGQALFLFVHKEHLVVSFGQNSAKVLIDQLNNSDANFANSKTFKAVAGRLSQMHVTSIHYADLKAFWSSVDPMLRMGMGMGQMQLMQMNPNYQTYVMPPMEQLVEPFATPAMELTYVDEKGLHVRSIEPFPGASFISPRGLFSIAVPAAAGFYFVQSAAMGPVEEVEVFAPGQP